MKASIKDILSKKWDIHTLRSIANGLRQIADLIYRFEKIEEERQRVLKDIRVAIGSLIIYIADRILSTCRELEENKKEGEEE